MVHGVHDDAHRLLQERMSAGGRVELPRGYLAVSLGDVKQFL